MDRNSFSSLLSGEETPVYCSNCCCNQQFCNCSYPNCKSWLECKQDGCERGELPVDRGECCVKNSKYAQSRLDYPPIANKVQALLFYGEYSLFRKWVVLVEGDFVQIRFSGGDQHQFDSFGQSGARVPKIRKCSLGDIRTLALTKNWLLICHMQRTYQVANDGLMPAGIVLHLRRLVPLKFVQISVSNPSQRVIAIENLSGLSKQYQLIERPGVDENEQYSAWVQAIENSEPKHDDETLLTTLRMYERWNEQHSCRITVVYPGKERISDTSLPDWKKKPSRRHAPQPSDQQFRNSGGKKSSSGKKLSSPGADTSHRSRERQSSFALRESDTSQSKSEKKKKHHKDKKKKKDKKEKDEKEKSKKETKKRKSEVKEKKIEKSDKQSQSTLKKNESDKKDKPKKLQSSTNSETDTGNIGEEASVGGNSIMTLSPDSEPAVGIETSVGPSHSITSENESGDQPAEEKRPKRSVRDVFRMGLFLSRKNKKKNSLNPATGPSTELNHPAETSRPRELIRRTSRLEMGIPIEEVFSEFQFATIEKKPAPPKSTESATQQSSDANDDAFTEEPYISAFENQSPSFSTESHCSEEKTVEHPNNSQNSGSEELFTEDLT